MLGDRNQKSMENSEFPSWDVRDGETAMTEFSTDIDIIYFTHIYICLKRNQSY